MNKWYKFSLIAIVLVLVFYLLLPSNDSDTSKLNEVVNKEIESDKKILDLDVVPNIYVGTEYLRHHSNEKVKDYLELNKIKKNITFIALEDVTDPRNIGSIIRSAASFGIDGLIFKYRHFPSNSKLMYKSSSGCMEHLNIFTVSNINTTLKYLRDNNFWVYGFDSKSDKDFTKIEWQRNVVLLFGSEGYGITKHSKKYADFLVKIKINDKIESLNVSNSASIVFHYINQHKK